MLHILQNRFHRQNCLGGREHETCTLVSRYITVMMQGAIVCRYVSSALVGDLVHPVMSACGPTGRGFSAVSYVNAADGGGTCVTAALAEELMLTEEMDDTVDGR